MGPRTFLVGFERQGDQDAVYVQAIARSSISIEVSTVAMRLVVISR